MGTAGEGEEMDDVGIASTRGTAGPIRGGFLRGVGWSLVGVGIYFPVCSETLASSKPIFLMRFKPCLFKRQNRPYPQFESEADYPVLNDKQDGIE